MKLHFAKTCGCAEVQYVDTARPLWIYPPNMGLAVLHGRRRDGSILDDEPAGDPEYA